MPKATRSAGLAVAIILATCGVGQAAVRVALTVVSAPEAFPDLRLEDELLRRLSFSSNLAVCDAPPEGEQRQDRGQSLSHVPEHNFAHADTTAARARYLVQVTVRKAGSEVRSSRLIPSLFKTHKRQYLLEVDLKIVDRHTARTLSCKTFLERAGGPRALAYLDLNWQAEPALYATYTEEQRIFLSLTEQMAGRLADEIERTLDDVQVSQK